MRANYLMRVAPRGRKIRHPAESHLKMTNRSILVASLLKLKNKNRKVHRQKSLIMMKRKVKMGKKTVEKGHKRAKKTKKNKVSLKSNE